MLLLSFLTLVVAWDATGRLEVTARCETHGGIPTESFLLHPAGGQPAISLLFGRLAKPPANQFVRVWGEASANTNGAHLVSRWTDAMDPRNSRQRLTKLRPQRVVDEEANMQVLMVRVSIAQHEDVCSESELESIMWTGESNARDFWTEMSLGRIRFERAASETPDITSVILSAAPLSCADVWPQVKVALQEQSPNINSELFGRHLLMLPADYRACGWASASIGCTQEEGVGCRLHLTACAEYPDSIVHELGHTLGLRHGAGLDENGLLDDYEDRSTVMGYSYPDAPRRGLNAVHRLMLGLRPGNLVELEPGWSGELSLSPLHADDSDASPAIKIARTSQGLYLSYRVAIGYESDLKQNLGGELGPSYDHVLQAHSSQLQGHSVVVAVLRQGDSTDISEGELSLLSASASSCRFSLFSPPACGNGRLDAGEECDGGPCCSQECKYLPSGILCRAASSLCDLPERCSGTTGECPANLFVPIGTLCRNSTGDPCDSASYCSAAGLCPPAGFPNGAACPIRDCDDPTFGNCQNRKCFGSCESESSPPSTQPASVEPICGDGVCQTREDCKSCPSDCPRGDSFCCQGFVGCLGRKCLSGPQLLAQCNLAIQPTNDFQKCYAGKCV